MIFIEYLAGTITGILIAMYITALVIGHFQAQGKSFMEEIRRYFGR